MENMAKQKKYSRPFSKAVDYYARVHAMTNESLAEKVGYPNGQMLQAIRAERSNGSEPMRRAIAQYFGFSLDDFIKEGERLIREQHVHPAAPVPGNLTRIDQQHTDVIKKFQNRELALEINEILLEIEQADPDKLEEVKDVLKAMVPKRQKAETKKRGHGTRTA
jgi:transcriptional regulator with XRE-family HTH domain